MVAATQRSNMTLMCMMEHQYKFNEEFHRGWADVYMHFVINHVPGIELGSNHVELWIQLDVKSFYKELWMLTYWGLNKNVWYFADNILN